MTPKKEIRIAVVGDVHDQWGPEDERALHQLEIDLVLFVGDFGNEAVGLVEQIARLSLPKAVILGNHDAWYSATDWGRKKCPYNRATEDRVQQQLDLLGDCHVGYGKLELSDWNLTIIGGRPFSWGGPEWKQGPFYAERYGVANLQASAERIKSFVRLAQSDTLLFIGHTGPTGLGEQPEDPCGRDWKPLGGDFGDPDLAAAIAYARQQQKAVPLVAFGHMHHHLRHRKDRLRKRWCQGAEGTLYLNAANVPRISTRPHTADHTWHNFSVVKLRHQQVVDVSLTWIAPALQSIENEVLYQAQGLAVPK